MPVTSFENFERQGKLAERIDRELAPRLFKRAKELGVTIVQVHDSLVLGGPLEKTNELLAWMKETTEELLNEEH